jgi:tetratricopeptide (TPR) repeat protein
VLNSLRVRARAMLATAAVMAILMAPAVIQAGAVADRAVKFEEAKAAYLEGRFQDALRMLDEVLAAGPDNGEALRYAGLCQMRLGNPEAALPLLERAVPLLPPASNTDVDAAWAAAGAKQYDRARTYAESALARDPANQTASLILAQALIGLGSFEEAIAVLAPLLDSPVEAQAANYYTGICYIRLGLTEKALPHFEQAVSLGPDNALGVDAAKYVAMIRAGGAPEEAQPTKPVSVRVRALFQYDSNLIPISEIDYLPVEVGRKDDIRLVADLDGRAMLLNRDHATFSTRLYVYQGFQSEVHQYDLRYYLVSTKATYTIGPLTMALGAGYSNAFMNENFYNDGFKVTPEFVFAVHPLSSIIITGDLAQEKYSAPFDPEFDLDNRQWHATLMQTLTLLDGRLNLWAGARWGRVFAEGDFYNRIDVAGLGGMIYTHPTRAQLSLLANYEDREYPTNFLDRHERRTTISGSLSIPVYENYDVYLGAIYSDIAANLGLFTYQRWIYSIGMQATF